MNFKDGMKKRGLIWFGTVTQYRILEFLIIEIDIWVFAKKRKTVLKGSIEDIK